LPLEALLADWVWLAELLCLLCELLEEFWVCWAWLEELLRLEAVLPELRVALPLSLVFAPLLELED
jgi:hypothetical protein